VSLRLFGLLAVAAFSLAMVGGSVTASVAFGGASFGEALAGRLQTVGGDPLATLILFAPFAGLGLISAAVADKAGRGRGLALFGVFGLVLAALYFHGFAGAERAMLAHRWTAAALSVGFLPFVAVPLLLVALFAGAWLTSRRNRPP
jgi:hypothetical protein